MTESTSKTNSTKPPLRRVRQPAPAFRTLKNSPAVLSGVFSTKSSQEADEKPKQKKSNEDEASKLLETEIQPERKHGRDCRRCAVCTGNCPI